MSPERATKSADRVAASHWSSAPEIQPHYDFVVCGAGSSGSVVARRLAENPDTSVLLVEAGGNDDVAAVTDPLLWPTNLGSERDWAFPGLPNPHLEGRSITFPMGKVLGGGSAINVMVWARGHKVDWNSFADETGDSGWGYESVLDIHRRRIEDWHGSPDPEHRGSGGPVFVQSAPDPTEIAHCAVVGAQSIGIPVFDSQNGRMMEGPGGVSFSDLRVRDGKRESVFRSYVHPIDGQANLSVLTDAEVMRVILDGERATGVEVSYGGTTQVIEATTEVVLCMGAINTPKVLMHSGIGDETELKRFAIPVHRHLPGVGRNFQDHPAFYCVWESDSQLPPRNNMAEVSVYWSTSDSSAPDVFIAHSEVPITTEATAARFGAPPAGWTLVGGVAHPKSRGRLHLTGSDPRSSIQIEDNMLAHPDDLKAALACIELCREIGNSVPLRPFSRREVMPGNLKGAELEAFVRVAATSYWHECGTAKMGALESMSVVDNTLRVYGVNNLRLADASVLPSITRGNTMASCVVIGERAAELIKSAHGL